MEPAPLEQTSVEVGEARTPPPLPRTEGSVAGMLWMILASVFFAMMNVAVRLGSTRLPWTEVASARAIIGALIAVGVALGRGASLTIHDRRISWARSLCGTCAMFCGFYAMGATSIGLGDVVTLNSTTPIFIALLSPVLLGESSGLSIWVVTSLSFAGVILIAGPSFHLFGGVALIAVLGSFFSALAMISLRKLGASEKKETPEAIVAHFSLVAAVALTLAAAPTLKVPDLKGGALLAVTGVLGGLGQLSMTRAYALERAARVGAAGYSAIVFTHLFSLLAFREAPSAAGTLGAILIMGAGLSLGLSAVRGGAGRRAARVADRLPRA